MQDYHLFGLLAQGPRSFVYKARRRRTLSYVCVKRTPRAQQQGVANEVAIHAAAGRHVNVLTLYSWYITQRHLYRVIEFCAGGDLGTLIAQDGGLPEAAVRLFGIDLLLGLLHCHSRGLLLCDGLRPSGVLLDENGSLRLSDFGNAQPYTDELRPPVFSSSSSSIARTAPELVKEDEFNRGSRGGSLLLHTRASDLWSLGVLLYELASGHTPFDAGSQGDNSPASVRKRILMDKYPPVLVPVLPSTKQQRKTRNSNSGGLKRTEEEREGKEGDEEEDEEKDRFNNVGDDQEEDEDGEEEDDDVFQSSSSAKKRIAFASDTFQDLIGKLLCKDPSKRINWNELLVHPFWRTDLDSHSGPPPEFQSVLQCAIDLPREVHLERQQRLPPSFNNFLEASGTSLMSTLLGLGTNLTSSQLTSNSLQRSSSKMDEDYADETAQISARLVRPHHPLPESLSSEDERKVASEGLLDDSSNMKRLEQSLLEQDEPTIDHLNANEVRESAQVRRSTQTSVTSQSAEIAPELLSLPVRYDPNNTNRSSRIYGALQQQKSQDPNISSIVAETVSKTLLQTQPSNSLILSSPNSGDILSLLDLPGQRLVTPIAASPLPPPLEPLTALPFECPGALLFSQEISSGQDSNFKSHLSLLYRALIFADVSTGRILSALNAHHPQDDALLNLQTAALAEIEALFSSGSDSLVNVLVNSSISSALAALSRYSTRDSIATSAGSVFARIVQRATNITSTLIFETGLLFSLAESLSDVLSLLSLQKRSKGDDLPSQGVPPFRPLSPLSPSFHLLTSKEASERPLNSETRRHIASAFGEVLFYAVSQSQTENAFSSVTGGKRLPDWLPPFLMHHVLSTSEPDLEVRKVMLHTLCNCLAHLPSISDQLCSEVLLPNIILELTKNTTFDKDIVNYSARACSMILSSRWFASASGGEDNAPLRIDSIESLAIEAADSVLPLLDSLVSFIDSVRGQDKNEASSYSAIWMLLSLGLMSSGLKLESLAVNKMLQHTISPQDVSQHGSSGAAFLVYSAAKTSALVRFGCISKAAAVMDQALMVFSSIWNRRNSPSPYMESADQEFDDQHIESCAALFAQTAAAAITTCLVKLTSSNDETSSESEELLLFLKACVDVVCATPSSLRVLCLFGDGKDKSFEVLLSSCLSRNNSPLVLQLSALACSLFNALDDSSCDDESRGLRPSIVRSVLPSALYLLPPKWPVLPLHASQFDSAEDHAKKEADAALVRLNLWPSLQLIYATLSQPYAISLLRDSTSSDFSASFVTNVAVAARDALLPCAASLFASLGEEINFPSTIDALMEADEEERSALKVFRSSILDIVRALVLALNGKGLESEHELARVVISPTESVHALLSLCAGVLLMPQTDVDDQTLQNDCAVCVDLLATAFKLAQRDWNWTITLESRNEKDVSINAPTSINLLIEALKSRNIADRNSIRTAVDACSAFLLRIAADMSSFQQDHEVSSLDQTFEGAGTIRAKGDLDETINSIKMLEAVVSGTGADVVMPELSSTPLRLITANASSSSQETYLNVPHQAFDDPLDADYVYARDEKKAGLLDASLNALSAIFPFVVLLAGEAHRNNDLGLLGSASSLLFLLCKYAPIKVAFHALFWTDSSKLVCIRTGLVPSGSAFFQHAPPLRHLLDLVTTAALHLNRNASRFSSHAELSLTLILRSCLSLTQASNDVLSAALRMRGDSLLSALKGIEGENAEELDAEEPRVPKVIRVRVKRGMSVTKKVDKDISKGIVRSIAQTATSLSQTLSK